MLMLSLYFREFQRIYTYKGYANKKRVPGTKVFFCYCNLVLSLLFEEVVVDHLTSEG